jgi:hypothetical protein
MHKDVEMFARPGTLLLDDIEIPINIELLVFHDESKPFITAPSEAHMNERNSDSDNSLSEVQIRLRLEYGSFIRTFFLRRGSSRRRKIRAHARRAPMGVEAVRIHAREDQAEAYDCEVLPGSLEKVFPFGTLLEG